MILALIGLVRATNPAMLRQGPDGFTVDFEALQGKQDLTGDERILVKLRATMEAPAGPQGSPLTLDLEPGEGKRLTETLSQLEALQPWPADVLNLSRSLRARLSSIT
jgi:hypothetical protein